MRDPLPPRDGPTFVEIFGFVLFVVLGAWIAWLAFATPPPAL